MPYKIEQRADKFVVVRENGGQVVGTHSSRAKATAQLRALYANVKDAIEKAMSRSEAGKYAAEQRWKNHVPATNAIANNQDRWEPAEYDGSLDGLLPNKNITPEVFDIETMKSKKIKGLTVHKIRMNAGGKVFEVIGVYVSPKNGKTYGISTDESGDALAYAKGGKSKVAGLQVQVNKRGEGEHEIFEALVINSHLRVGLMTAMLETVRATLGGVVHHSDLLSEQGAAWASATPFDKAKFGSRSEAGRYAAEQRWKNHAKKQETPVSLNKLSDNLKTQINLVGQAMENVRAMGIVTQSYVHEDLNKVEVKKLKAELLAIDKKIERAERQFGFTDATLRGTEAVRLAHLAIDQMAKTPSEYNLEKGKDELLISRDSDGNLVGLAMTFTTHTEFTQQSYLENEQSSQTRQLKGAGMSLEFLVSFQTVKGMGRALFGEAIKRSLGKNILFTQLEATDFSKDYWERVGFRADPNSLMYNKLVLVTPLDNLGSLLP